MPKQLHINVTIHLPDDHWQESDVKSVVKPLYDQFYQALIDARITFQDAVKVTTPRPPKPKLEAVATPAAPPVAA